MMSSVLEYAQDKQSLPYTKNNNPKVWLFKKKKKSSNSLDIMEVEFYEKCKSVL